MKLILVVIDSISVLFATLIKGHLYKLSFSAIAASAPCSNPHVLPIHCGSARGGYSGGALALRASLWLLSPLRFGSLHSRKNPNL